ncbi:hypothetical protein [Alkalibacillus silvisoli]|uniref:Uncharacterized protein n=1 Tax=Alkalibacillus silvisoli TaxID=392823 RepID=A0ABN1A2Y2_9BACI
MAQQEHFNQIMELTEQLHEQIETYWHQFSSFDTWQFWVNLFLVILPLIILYFAIDRTRIFEILFYGLSVHMLWNYSSNYLESETLFVTVYFTTPLLPYAFSMVASALPVAFMLLYQYCTNRGKNFYIYVILLSAFFALLFAPLETMIGLTYLGEGFNYFYIFLIDIVIAIGAYWLVQILIKSRDRAISKT